MIFIADLISHLTRFQRANASPVAAYVEETAIETELELDEDRS